MREKKLVLIEDEYDHAELITDVLKELKGEKIKMEIILKKDGEEAINYFKNEKLSKVSLIILDLNLPKINGMEVLKFIMKNSKYSSIPVIILSTNSEQQMIHEAYKNGAYGYFVKPASYEDFVEKIRTLCTYI